jgi:hypothetical protein
LNKEFHLISLHQWNFLFAIGAILAFIAVELLFRVKEVGEVEKDVVVRVMRSNLKSNLKEAFLIGQMINWHDQFWRLLRGKKENGDQPEEENIENTEQRTRSKE